LIAGGIAYTAGTLFFANERLRYGHFVWHLFVLAGTTCHFCGGVYLRNLKSGASSWTSLPARRINWDAGS
jgi:hypothetical protein